jgi:ribosomal-protein-alanine N-acetyltransferase
VEFWEQQIAEHRSYVAVTGGQVVGYCLCSASGSIVSLAVRTEHQRNGLARKLLQSAIQQVPSQTYNLHVRVSNDIALALYRSLGFEVAEELPNYYGEGANGYLMRRPGE